MRQQAYSNGTTVLYETLGTRVHRARYRFDNDGPAAGMAEVLEQRQLQDLTGSAKWSRRLQSTEQAHATNTPRSMCSCLSGC